MSRYKYVTITGRELDLQDWLMTEHGIEGIQINNGKATLVLVLPDGSIMFDTESDKTLADFEWSRNQYREAASRSEESVSDRAKHMIEEAASIEYADEEMDEDEKSGPMIKVPKLKDVPEGYA